MSDWDVTIIIPTWNGRHLLERFLGSVHRAGQTYVSQTGYDVEVIVVDDGSTDATADWLRDAHPHIVVARKERNEGFGPACNVGLAQARYPIIFLLNNDVSVNADVLLYLVPHFADPSVFAVCCKALDMHTNTVATAGKVGQFKRGFWRVHANYDVNSQQCTVTRGQLPETGHQQPVTGDYYSMLASGGFSAFSADKLRALGGFNCLLAPFYWEDVDLSWRAWKRGWKILYEPQAVVYHATSSTIGSHFEQRQVQEIAQRNRLITHWINLHDRRFLIEHIVVVLLLLFAAPLTANFSFWRAFWAAWQRRAAILEQRERERRAVQRSDRQLANLLSNSLRRPDIRLLSMLMGLLITGFMICCAEPQAPIQSPSSAETTHQTPTPTAIRQDAKRELAKRQTSNAAALQAYLQGREQYERRTGQALDHAIASFQRAIRLDPNLAVAYVDLADCYLIQSHYETRPPQDFFPKAKQALTKALRLDDTMADAHAQLGYIHLRYEWDWNNAEIAFRRALALDPSLLIAHQWYSEFLSAMGRHEQAIEHIRQAQALDRASPSIAAQLGLRHYFARQYDQAVEAFRHALELDATSASARRDLALVYLQTGRVRDAISELQRAVEYTGHKTTAALLAHAYAVSGNKEEARKILSNLLASAQQTYASAYAIALVYAGLDDQEKMFIWLKKAYEQRTLPPSFFKVHPLWDRWRSDPRFVTLARRVGLAP
ncbi:MAG: glycosyltransferase [Acidobacteriota bacterium]|nr:glycosyltransferase [Blastocatellia bacterium]MDW8239504.1 glycosyltransferase [Acidobacteriota bacterium]